MSKIYDIQTIPAEIIGEVGGKARGLHRLSVAGFTVPRAFIVTDIQPDDDLNDVVDKYHQTGLQLVSVRSSATLEDGNDYSAAGQFSTFLNIEGDDNLKQAVRDCVASLHNAVAEKYTKTFLQSAESKMTVVVQEMVDARCAGVIFTKAPMRGAGYSLVEVVPGLGENLVSGKMSAQQFRVRPGRVEQMPKEPWISENEALELGKEGIKIEKLFGQPMDLEWAMNQKGEIQWLQARPITVQESVTMNELDCREDVSNCVITTSNIGEVMPGAVTPLNLSTNMLALDWGVMETYRQIGCIPHEVEPYQYISSYYNHMFFNMTNMYQVCHAMFGSTKETMDISICGHVLEGFPDLDISFSTLERARNTRVFMRYLLGGDAAKKGMDKTITSMHFDLRQDMHSIYQQILDNFQALKWVQYYHYRTSYYSGGQTNFLMMAVEKHFESREQMQSAIAGCLTEIDDFESANVLRQMRALGEAILRHCPNAASYSIEQLDHYFQTEMNDEVHGLYDAFMHTHGHRGIREMEMRSPSWKANSTSFCNSMRSILISLSNERSGRTPQVRHWTEYANDLLTMTPRILHPMVKALIRNARKGVCYREYTKAKVVYAVDLYKQAYAALAKKMVEANLLPDDDAIYFLLQDEVGRLLQGEQALVKKALARRRIYPQQMELKFADTCMGIPQPLASHHADPHATKFQGTPVSRGVATGKARVVHNEEEAAQLQVGEIMVAACTDVGWAPYYNTISGLITEIGSALSHGIVVAREYALPAVVNVTDCMQNIHTGDEITLDANTGNVFINQRANNQ